MKLVMVEWVGGACAFIGICVHVQCSIVVELAVLL